MTANENEALVAFASTLSTVQDHSTAWIEEISSLLNVRLWAGSPKAAAHRITDRGRAAHTRNSYKIKPTISDLVCDVQIAARHALSPSEFARFKLVYLEMGIPAERNVGDDAMRAELGAAFIEGQIVPTVALSEPRERGCSDEVRGMSTFAALKRETNKRAVINAFEAYQRQESLSVDNLMETVRDFLLTKLERLDHDFNESAVLAEDRAQDALMDVWSRVRLGQFIGDGEDFFAMSTGSALPLAWTDCAN